MENSQIVTPNELEKFAQTNLSEGVIPELVWKLVNNSVKDLTDCRIPYGDSIGLPGLDGFVTTLGGYNQFIPKGKSYWEIGTGARPGTKATSDYKKTTYDDKTKLKPEELAEAAYVFLTPLSKAWSFQAQEKWRESRKADGWKEIKTIDGIVLADWLTEYPSIAKWLLKRMGYVDSSIGFVTVENQLRALLPLNCKLKIDHLASHESAGLQAVDMFCWGFARKDAFGETDWFAHYCDHVRYTTIYLA